MKISLKKILIVPLCLIIMFYFVSLFSDELYADNYNEFNGVFDNLLINDYKENIQLNNDDQIEIIIELQMLSVIDFMKKIDYKKTVNEYLNCQDGITYLNKIKLEQNVFIKQLSKKIQYEFIDSYYIINNGIAIKTKYKNINEIKKIDGVKSVNYSIVYEPTNYSLDGENTVIDVRNNDDDSRYTGKNMLVGIIDTGLKIDHEAFQVMPSETKITKQFVEDILTNTQAFSKSLETINSSCVYVNDKIPFVYDYADNDSNVIPNLENINSSTYEHGTMVSGIACGNNGVDYFGSAKDAQLAFFKVYSDNQAGASTVDIVAALNDAVVLGVDVINLSLGSPCGFAVESSGEEFQSYFDKVEEAGIYMVCAVGNQYSAGYGTNYPNGTTSWLDQGTISSPASYENSFAVGSFDSENVRTNLLKICGLDVEYRETIINSKTNEQSDFVLNILNSEDEKTFEIIDVGYGSIDECKNVDLNGKIALVKRGGGISFGQKVVNVENSLGVGVIFYNNVGGVMFNSIVEGSHIPSCSISLDDAKLIIESGRSDIVIKRNYCIYGSKISNSSSWGPLTNLDLKPEILAFGGGVYAPTLSGDTNSYQLSSGTSMAAPKVSGDILKLKQYLKENNISDQDIVYRLLMSTATPQVNPYHSVLYSPRLQGAGLINFNDAIESNAYLYVDDNKKTKLELGDDAQKLGIYELHFNLCNLSNESKTYIFNPTVLTTELLSDNFSLGKNSVQIEDVKFKYYVTGNATLKNDTITVEEKSTVNIKVEIELGSDIKQYLDEYYHYGTYIDGFIELESLDSNPNLSIPYLEYYGSWSNAPIFDGSKIINKTLVMGKYNNNYIELGKYQHILPEGYTEPLLTNDHYVLATKNSSAINDLYSVYMGILRNSVNLKYEIYDSNTLELLDSFDKNYVRKTIYDPSTNKYSYLAHQLDFLLDYANNSHLKMVVTATLYSNLGGSITRQSFDFDFYIDNEMPKILNTPKYINENGEKYLEFEVYDNHILQSYSLKDSNGKMLSGYIPFYTTINDVTKVRYNITSIVEELPNNQIIISVDDYAMNTTVYEVNLPNEKIERINFVEETIEMQIGEVKKLEYVIFPFDAYYDFKSIKIISDNIDIVKVDGVNIALAQSAGLANLTLTIKTLDDEEIKTTITINVIDEEKESFEDNDSGFIIVNNELIKYIGNDIDVIIPDNVTKIKEEAFKGTPIQSIVIPQSVLEIGNAAFAECKNLKTVYLNAITRLLIENNTTIDKKIFYNCNSDLEIIAPIDGYYDNSNDGILYSDNYQKIEYVYRDFAESSEYIMKDSVKELAPYAFANSSINNIKFPKKLINIPVGAFYNCKMLEEIDLPSYLEKYFINSSVDPDSHQPFEGCTSLKNIFIAEGNSYFTSVDGVLYNKEKTILYSYPAGRQNSNYSVLEGTIRVMSGAFRNNINLEMVVLPSTLKVLGDNAFYGCTNLSTVVSLAKEAFVLEQSKVLINDSIIECNYYGNFVDYVYAYSYGIGGFKTNLKLITIEDSVGYNAWQFQLFFNEIKECSIEELVEISNLKLSQEEKNILISWDESLLNVICLIYRKYNDEKILIGRIDETTFIDETAKYFDVEYEYLITPICYVGSAVYFGKEISSSIYKEATSEELALREIVDNINLIETINDYTIIDLLENTYQKYCSLTSVEKELIINSNLLKNRYMVYREVKEFTDFIHDIDVMNFENLDLIIYAKEQFNLLSNEHKQLLSNEDLQCFEKLNKTYDSFEKIASVIQQINNLEKLENATQKDIQSAIDAYNGLSAFEKKYVPDDVVDILKSYQESDSNNNCNNCGSLFAFLSIICLLSYLFKFRIFDEK